MLHVVPLQLVQTDLGTLIEAGADVALDREESLIPLLREIRVGFAGPLPFRSAFPDKFFGHQVTFTLCILEQNQLHQEMLKATSDYFIVWIFVGQGQVFLEVGPKDRKPIHPDDEFLLLPHRFRFVDSLFLTGYSTTNQQQRH